MKASEAPSFRAFCDEAELTPAECIVLRLALDEGLDHAGIARQIGVDVSTVKKQSHHVCKKTGAASLKLAVVMVLRKALDDASASREQREQREGFDF